jgi:hypothetical protein
MMGTSTTVASLIAAPLCARATRNRSTSTKRVQKSREVKKLREKIDLIENMLSQSLHRQIQIGLREEAIRIWNQIQKITGWDAPTTSEAFGTDLISSKDKTLRSSWAQTAFIVTDGEVTEETPEADGSRGGWGYGVLEGTPSSVGPRFNTPSWVTAGGLRRFARKLFRSRRPKFNTVEERDQMKDLCKFLEEKSAIESKTLFDYFVDQQSYQQIWEKYSRPNPEFYFVGVADAKDSIQGALEFAAEKNNSFIGYDDHGDVVGPEESKDLPAVWYDERDDSFRSVSAKKMNGDFFRVEIRMDIDDHYYLQEELNPAGKKGTRPLQGYIESLVRQGYKLLKKSKPTKADRQAAKQEREAARETEVARAQYGSKCADSDPEADSKGGHRLSQEEILDREYQLLEKQKEKFNRSQQADEAREELPPAAAEQDATLSQALDLLYSGKLLELERHIKRGRH